MSVSDGRAAKRLRVLKAAKIWLPGTHSIVDCTVRDVSDTGAKVLCGEPALVPDEFRLVIIQDNTIRDVKVMWRKTDSLGVNFTSPATRAPPRKWT
jgi:hypothetical protein